MFFIWPWSWRKSDYHPKPIKDEPLYETKIYKYPKTQNFKKWECISCKKIFWTKEKDIPSVCPFCNK